MNDTLETTRIATEDLHRRPVGRWDNVRAWGMVGIALALLAAPQPARAQGYDYQDYRDAGYFDDGFYDDDWYYDWYDTGYSEQAAQADYSRYYEEESQRRVAKLARTDRGERSGRTQRGYEEEGRDRYEMEPTEDRRGDQDMDQNRRGRSSQRSQLWKMSGDVERGKRVRILGTDTDHLVVLLKTYGARRIAVDLGPIADLRGTPIRTGDWISVTGVMGRVGERRVFMAHRLMSDEREPITIDRHRQRVAGRIEDLAKARVRGTQTENLVARVKTEEGRQVLIDLGDPQGLKEVDVRKGAWISVRGPAIPIMETPIVMARQVRMADERLQVSRVFPSDEDQGKRLGRSGETKPSPLQAAIQSAREADRAGKRGEADIMVQRTVQALTYAQQGDTQHTEQAQEGMAALQDAIKHGRQGNIEDAREHLQHAIMRLSQVEGRQLPEGMPAGTEQASRQDVAEEAKPVVLEALAQARLAKRAARQQRPEQLRHHAEQALAKAKQAQRFGHNERLNEGVYQLGDALEHAKQDRVQDAAGHLDHAIAKLTKSIGSPIERAIQRAEMASRERVAGEVVVKGQVLQIDRDGFYIVRDPSGKDVRMIVGEGVRPDVRVGDAITAEVRPDGRVLSMEKDTGQQ